MKLSFKFVLIVALLFFFAQSSFAWVTNHIDSFETPSGILFGVDKYCKIELTNEYYTDGKFALKLSFNTNYPTVVRNFFLPVLSADKKNEESLLFDAYNRSGSDIILFYKIFFASNKITETSTKLIKYKNTTVEIPYALVRNNIDSISGYQFYITNSTKNISIYFDDFRTEKSSYSPFKKIAFLDLADEPFQTGNFFFSRGILGQIFKTTIPLPFEKIKRVKLFAAKGETINYAFSFRTHKKQDQVSIKLSDFISEQTNILSLITSVGKVKPLDKRLSYDSKFYVEDMPMYIKNGNCFTNLHPRTSQTFMLTLKIPETATSGTYNANIIFETITGAVTNENFVPVSLCVFPFTINENTLSNNFILNYDQENTKPEVNRYASGFFKVAGGSNNIVKFLPQIILGDAYDDFDRNVGDRISIFSSNEMSVAHYASNIGNNDFVYFNVLKSWLSKAKKQNFKSPEIKKCEDDINYLITSLKTTPPLNIASKWTGMLTKEQVNLIGKTYDTNAIAFVTGEQELPNGWTAKDYNRARSMLAHDIMNLMELCGVYSNNVNVSTSLQSKVSFIESISIPLSRGKAKKKNKDTIYSVRELLSIPEINGEIDENEWRNSLKVKRFSKISGGNDSDAQTEAQLGWYESNFYIQVTCYKNNKLNMKSDSVELYIKPGNENKIWNKLSVNFAGEVKGVKSDGKLWKQNINVQSSLAPRLAERRARGKNDDWWSVEFAIPLTNCLTHSSDFGLNICRKNIDNIFAWKTFSKNKLKFAHIKLDGADKIVEILIPPIKKQPLKIISSDAFAFAKEDFITVETEWDGDRKLLKKSKLKFKIIGVDKKEYSTITSKQTVPRQKTYLKLNDFNSGIYKINVDLIDMDGIIISSANTKIKILPCHGR